jgi:hypothetical protein
MSMLRDVTTAAGPTIGPMATRVVTLLGTEHLGTEDLDTEDLDTEDLETEDRDHISDTGA